MMDIQFADPKYVEKKKQDSGNITYIYSDGHVKARHKKKLKTLSRLAKTIKDLRRKVAEDLDSPEKGELAMVVALIDETYERVGNPESAAGGHFGVTTWRKKHVSFPGSKAVIKYKGKAGVDQKKTVASKHVVDLLKGLVSQKKADDELFPEVTAADINAYLKPFKITAKDIRGFHANEEMKKALAKTKKKGGDEKQRKEEFKRALEETAKTVGHDPGTLKKDYLVPSFEENYLEHGRIGAKNSASAADKENRYMVSRTAIHIDRMLAIRKLAKKDKKKQWEQDSAMLAVMAPPGVVRRLKKVVDEETVSPDGLHVTLLFLGKVADLDDATMKAIQRAAEKVCVRHQPLAMRVSGAGRFAPGEDGTPVYIVPNAKGLSALQADLENAVSSIIDLPSEHGWVPHMTVGYACDDNPDLPVLKSYPEWTARSVRFQAGGKTVADLPLGRRKTAAAADAGQTDEEPAYVGPLERQTEENDYFRQVLFTGNHSQLVLMTLKPGEDIGEEIHKDTDQFFRVDEGEGKAILDGTEYSLRDGSGVLVPSGTRHNIVNTGKDPLKLYTVYSPPHHGHGEIRKTKEEAQGAERRDENVQAAMDRLPIAADPVLWSDEQLTEAVKNPRLREELEKQPELLKAVLEQIAKRKGAQKDISPKDIGEWIDRGWFMLFDGTGLIMGFFRNKSGAELARQRLASMFEQGRIPDRLLSRDAVADVLGSAALGHYRAMGGQGRAGRFLDAVDANLDEAAEEFLTHPFYAERRKKLADDMFGVIKMPQNFQPRLGAAVKGAVPDAGEVSAAGQSWIDYIRDNEPRPQPGREAEWEEEIGKRPYYQEMDTIRNRFNREFHDAMDGRAKQIAGRQRMKEEGVDPENMADDSPLSQRAMDRLPIAADPALWSDEQIAEVLKTPHLREKLEKKPELLQAVKEQVEKRKAVREGLQPQDIGHWRERGWFLLQGMDWPLGWYSSAEAAELTRKRLVDMFAEGRNAPFSIGTPKVRTGKLQRNVANKFFGPDWKPEKMPRWDAQQQYDELRKDTRQEADEAADNLQNHPFYEGTRRKLGEKYYKILKAPQSFEPDREAVVESGGFPTDDTVKAASKQLNEDAPENRRINEDFWKNAEEAMDAEEEFYEGEANKIAKRLRMKREGIDPDKMADDAPKAAGFVGRMIHLAETLDDAGDHEGAERLCRQMDFLIGRRAHFVPSDKTKAPPMWRKNLDYGEDSPYYGSVKDFLKKYPGGLGEYIKKRRKSRKKRERKWKLSALAEQDSLERAMLDEWRRNEVENDLEDAMEAVAARHAGLRIARMMKLRQLWKVSQAEEENGEEELQEIRDDYIKDPKKAPREFVKYWSILLKDLRRKRKKKKGKGK